MAGGRRKEADRKISLGGNLKKVAPEMKKAVDSTTLLEVFNAIDASCIGMETEGGACGEIMKQVDKESVKGQMSGELPYVKVTHNILAKLEIAIRSGLSEVNACSLAGITLGDFDVMMKKYPRLKDYIDTWKHDLNSRIELNLAQAVMNGDIEVSKWMAQNRMPEKYNASRKQEITVESTVKHKMLPPTVEDMKAVQNMVHINFNLDKAKLPEPMKIDHRVGMSGADYDEEDEESVDV